MHRGQLQCCKPNEAALLQFGKRGGGKVNVWNEVALSLCGQHLKKINLGLWIMHWLDKFMPTSCQCCLLIFVNRKNLFWWWQFYYAIQLILLLLTTTTTTVLLLLCCYGKYHSRKLPTNLLRTQTHFCTVPRVTSASLEMRSCIVKRNQTEYQTRYIVSWEPDRVYIL